MRDAGFAHVESTRLKWLLGGVSNTRHFGEHYAYESTLSIVAGFKGILGTAVSTSSLEGFQAEEDAQVLVAELEDLLMREGGWTYMVSVVGRRPS